MWLIHLNFRTTWRWTNCGMTVNPCGDHLLYCEGGGHRISRHNAQVERLALHLVKTAKHPVKEARSPCIYCRRPDIKALGTPGWKKLIDVAISHTLLPAWLGTGTEPNGQGVPNAACSSKMAKHHAYMDKVLRGHTPHLVQISALEWDHREEQLLELFSQSLRLAIAPSFYGQRHSFSKARGSPGEEQCALPIVRLINFSLIASQLLVFL